MWGDSIVKVAEAWLRCGLVASTVYDPADTFGTISVALNAPFVTGVLVEVPANETRTLVLGPKSLPVTVKVLPGTPVVGLSVRDGPCANVASGMSASARMPEPKIVVFMCRIMT